MPYLYAVQMQIPDYPFNPIKIGFSKCPEFRFTQFTAGPFPTVFLGKWTARQGQFSEFLVHDLFARYRLVGEWFYPAQELVDFIAKRIKGEPQSLTDKSNLKRFEQNYSRLGTVAPVTSSPWFGSLNRECDRVVTTEPPA
jgi:hypothetical protein